MTDQQIIEAVLKSCGWTVTCWTGTKEDFNASIPCLWEKNGMQLNLETGKAILTSLDACHEVFEKDALDGYWTELLKITITSGGPMNLLSLCKATPHQRCLAWPKFKGVEIE